MFLTITTTHTPATDLGYLLHKNPAHVHTRKQSYGAAHVFYPEAAMERCTAALYVEVDPVGLVRNRRGPSGEAGLLNQYVNDRPYVASSLLSVAIADTYGSALNGRCNGRPDLVTTPIPLEIHLPVAPGRGGEALLRSLFEPLGYEVETRRLDLDERFPAWGESQYLSLTLRIVAPLQAALSHLYVLIPVLDNNKHYWVDEAEVQKLLRHGETWLGSHPQRELIIRRYLKFQRSLTGLAIARLVEDDGSASDVDSVLPGAVSRADQPEGSFEDSLPLKDRRMAAVANALASLAATSAIDLGCGEGRFLKRLLDNKALNRITGVDVSHRALEQARESLNIDRLPRMVAEKLSLLHGSLMYRDARFAGYDVATVVEVVEHLDPPRLKAFERVLFEYARPEAVILTTPNREFNLRFPSLPAGQFRHSDHRFEWTRREFEAWAADIAERYDYQVRFEPVGDEDANLGAPTQMAVFTKNKGNPK